MSNIIDDNTHEMGAKAQDFQNLLSQLTILPGKEDVFLLALKKQIKDEKDTDDITIKINKSISNILSNYNQFGISQSGISELDLYQSNEICANATQLLDELISFFKKEDILHSNDLIINLENEKNIYIQMHHIVYSLISNIELNENKSTENDLFFESNLRKTQEINQSVNENNLDAILEDPTIKEKLEIYDLDSELVDTALWNDVVTEIRKAFGNRQSNTNLDNLDELLETIDQDSKELDRERLHAIVSNDIKEAKSSIRTELEEKYKTILNSTIQISKGERDDSLALILSDSNKIISQLYNSLTSLGVDDPAMVKLDEDKFKFANDLCKLLQEQIILNQYQQFMREFENISKSVSITNEERFDISTLHAKLVNNIQEFYIQWEANDNMQNLWDTSDSNMLLINQKYEQQIISQRKEKQALKEATVKNTDLTSLIAKANEAIDHKDLLTLIDVKKQLLDQQTYLNKALEKSIHSTASIQPLRVAMNSVSECLKKINNELGITTPISLPKPKNKEGLENPLPSLSSGRMTR